MNPIKQHLKQREDAYSELFDYSDFSGDLGRPVLYVKYDGYDTEETLRNKINSLSSQLLLEKVMEVEEEFSVSWDNGGETDNWVVQIWRKKDGLKQLFTQINKDSDEGGNFILPNSTRTAILEALNKQ